MKTKRWIALFLLLCLCLSSCKGRNILYADFREIENLELIRTIGVDIGDNGLMDVTAATGMKSEGDTEIILKSSAVTVARALAEMQNYTSKKYIFFGHTKNVVVGEEAALTDLQLCLEYMQRGVDLRLDTLLCIVKGSSARESISSCSDQDSTITELLESLVKDVKLMSESRLFGCGEVMEQLSRNGSALVAAIELKEEEEIVEDADKNIIRSAGFAVVVDRKLVCFIDPYYSRGVCLLIDQVVSDVTEVPDAFGGYTALEITGGGSEFDAVIRDGRVEEIQVDVHVTANISEVQNRVNVYDDSFLAQLEQALAEMELVRVQHVLELSQSLGADFIGIGNRFNMKHPIAYHNLHGTWNEQFPNVPIQITVEARVERTYDMGISKSGREDNSDHEYKG